MIKICGKGIFFIYSFFSSGGTVPPRASILSTRALRSAMQSLMYSIAIPQLAMYYAKSKPKTMRWYLHRFNTIPSLLPCPSHPGINSVNLSNPSRIAFLRFCSLAMWLFFFSCSVSLARGGDFRMSPPADGEGDEDPSVGMGGAAPGIGDDG